MIGAVIRRYETVTSTNDVAGALAAQGADEGTVVVAAEQTRGRGSRGRGWLSPAGSNLLVSIILRPCLPPDRFGELAFVAAVAVAETLRNSCGLDATVKWPNDVQVRGKKISGIIVEAAKGAAILGIGLNSNWTDLPEEIAETATSIEIESGAQADLEMTLSELMTSLDAAYTIYLSHGFERILQQWKAFETTTGKQVSVRLEGGTIDGVAVDVDERGNLIVRLADGERRAIPASTIVSYER
ncbi:MAG: biotin--[acetyl-CoA-carboxylase] ligase [Armatimonadetes bacterium]|nr:biotin--[acetyl-CoA-carboxylase] ligase [Armatimonadota bacterium]